MKTKVTNKRNNLISPDDVYIGRPSQWGNPFTIGKHGDRDEVIKKFIDHFDQKEFRNRVRQQLQGKHLVCWCKPAACHGDWLAMIADQEIEE